MQKKNQYPHIFIEQREYIIVFTIFLGKIEICCVFSFHFLLLLLARAFPFACLFCHFICTFAFLSFFGLARFHFWYYHDQSRRQLAAKDQRSFVFSFFLLYSFVCAYFIITQFSPNRDINIFIHQ